MLTRAKLILVSMSLFTATACAYWGVRPSANGITIRLTALGRGARVGELLAASDSGVVILISEGDVVFTPYSVGTHLSGVRGTPRVRFEGHPDSGDRELLAYHSRYPLGLADDTLGRLLSALGQDEVIVWPAVTSGGLPAGGLRSDRLQADELQAGALRALERYGDPAQASLDGYRIVSPDFPGMGTHWVHAPTLLSSDVDTDHPSVLCYTDIDGRLTLVNVAYGWALLGGASQPAVEGLPSDTWHDHTGSVSEEMLNPHGLRGGQHGSAEGAGSRVAMLHVWT